MDFMIYILTNIPISDWLHYILLWPLSLIVVYDVTKTLVLECLIGQINSKFRRWHALVSSVRFFFRYFRDINLKFFSRQMNGHISGSDFKKIKFNLLISSKLTWVLAFHAPIWIVEQQFLPIYFRSREALLELYTCLFLRKFGVQEFFLHVAQYLGGHPWLSEWVPVKL